MCTADTWRALCEIGEPRTGVISLLFLHQPQFPSHPKTHDWNANTADQLRPETQSQIESHRSVLQTSGFGVFFSVFFFASFFLPPSLCPAAAAAAAAAGQPDFWLNQLV